jgi:hypothetical protein
MNTKFILNATSSQLSQIENQSTELNKILNLNEKEIIRKEKLVYEYLMDREGVLLSKELKEIEYEKSVLPNIRGMHSRYSTETP